VGKIFIAARSYPRGPPRRPSETTARLLPSGRPGACAFLRLGGGPQLALYARPDAVAETSSPVLVAWDVPDVEAARAALLERGVDVADTQPVPGGRAALFSDPEGNRLEIHQPD
jgi:predicted enzyme related to lactoylglutathione lyase